VFAIFYVQLDQRRKILEESTKLKYFMHFLGFLNVLITLTIMMRRFIFTWWFKLDWDGKSAPFSSPGIAFFIVKELLWPTFFGEVFEWNFLCFAGKISYPLYLIHPIFMVHRFTFDNPGDQLMFAFGPAIFISTLIHYGIESPITKLTHRICIWVKAAGSERLMPMDPESGPSYVAVTSTDDKKAD
jgi:peptidoglycan/LPS O-acetylase OafA/YrhL